MLPLGVPATQDLHLPIVVLVSLIIMDLIAHGVEKILVAELVFFLALGRKGVANSMAHACVMRLTRDQVVSYALLEDSIIHGVLFAPPLHARTTGYVPWMQAAHVLRTGLAHFVRIVRSDTTGPPAQLVSVVEMADALGESRAMELVSVTAHFEEHNAGTPPL